MGKKKDPGAGLRQEAQQKTHEALQQFKGIDPLRASELMYDLIAPELVGKLEAEQLGETEMAGISTDPELRDAQMGALRKLQEMGEEGLTAEDKAVIDDIRRGAEAQSQAQQKAIMQSMAERGTGGAGAELAARLSASQASSNRASQAGMDVAAQSAAARRQALAQSGALAGNMEGQQFGQQSQVAQAKDTIARLNAQQRAQVAGQNLAQRQRIAEAQAATANQQAAQKSGALQAEHQSELGLAGAKAGILGGQANMLNQQSQMQKGKISPLGAIGTLAGAGIGLAAGGGAAGAYKGAQVGGLTGGAAGMLFEDGGIAPNSDHLEGEVNPANYKYEVVAEDGAIAPLTMPNSNPEPTDQFSLLNKQLGTEIQNPDVTALEAKPLEKPQLEISARELKESKGTPSSSNETLGVLAKIAGKAAKQQKQEAPIHQYSDVDFGAAKVPQYKSVQLRDGGTIGEFRTGPNASNDFLECGIVEDWSDVYSGMPSEAQDYIQQKVNMDIKFADGGLPKEAMEYADGGTGDDKMRQLYDALMNMKRARESQANMPTDLRKLTEAAQYKAVNAAGGKEIAQKAFSNEGLDSLLDVAKKRMQGSSGQKMMKNITKGVAKKGLKALPIVGGIGAALVTGDASAAVPLLNEADELGPEKGSLGRKLEMGEPLSDEEMKQLEEESKNGFACGGTAHKDYEQGGIEEGDSYVGDRVDAKINSGEMVLNLDQQQRLMELLRGRITPPEMPMEKDIVEPATEEETNLDSKNKELEARISALESLLTNK